MCQECQPPKKNSTLTYGYNPTCPTSPAWTREATLVRWECPPKQPVDPTRGRNQRRSRQLAAPTSTNGNPTTTTQGTGIAIDVRSKRNKEQTGFPTLALEETLPFVCADNVRRERMVCVLPFRSACVQVRCSCPAPIAPAVHRAVVRSHRSPGTHQCIFTRFEHFDFQHFPPVLEDVVQSRVVGGLVGQRF